jgi:predicted metallo-beta-lactamase superfamily hydrolase
MGQPYYSDFDISHETVYEELARTKAENFHLKKQLKNKNEINKGQKKTIAALSKKLKAVNKNEQHYRNGRKRGTRGFNG